MTGKRFLGGFEPEGPLQLLVADAGRILIGDMKLSKCPIRDAQCKLPVPLLGVENAVGVIPAVRF
jgi:hypothetical protein